MAREGQSHLRERPALNEKERGEIEKKKRIGNSGRDDRSDEWVTLGAKKGLGSLSLHKHRRATKREAKGKRAEKGRGE